MLIVYSTMTRVADLCRDSLMLSIDFTLWGLLSRVLLKYIGIRFHLMRQATICVIVVNERHLKRLMSEYLRYYNEDRTHLTLAKGTPAGRDAATTFETHHRVVSTPRLGGLHHRYDLAA